MKEVQTPCFQNTWNNSSNISPNEVYYSKADFLFPQILFLFSFTVPSLVPQLSDLKYGPMGFFLSFHHSFWFCSLLLMLIKLYHFVQVGILALFKALYLQVHFFERHF